MNESHYDLLSCPNCGGGLLLDRGVNVTIPLRVPNDTGLNCEACSIVYPIIAGVPRFVPESNYSDGFGFQWHQHRTTQHDSQTGLSISEDRFFEETRWDRNLKGQLILEVGCGSGRFTAHAIETGAMVVSVDLSSAVVVNAKIHQDAQNFLGVQADLANLPFKDNFFDKVFCLGVIQHTPSPEESFSHLTRHLKPGGELVMDVYDTQEGWRSWIEPVYRNYLWLRPITKRMPPQVLYNWVERYTNIVWPLTRQIAKAPILGRMFNKLLLIHDYRLRYALSENELKQWSILDTFDNLAPAYDFRQSRSTVRRWFDAHDYKNIQVCFGHNGIEGRGTKSNDR